MTKHIKIWALMLCLILVVASFVACNKDKGNETPTTAPSTEAPTEAPTTEAPTTEAPTEAPSEETTTEAPTTEEPTTEEPTTEEPTTEEPTTEEPTTEAPTECAHTGGTATCTEKATCTVCGEKYGELAPNNHTGGTATCTEKATCTACGEKYGELNANNHAGTETTWTKTEAAHKETYNCCGAVKVAEAAHTFVEGVCSVCEYACVHTGGEANCKTAAKCSVCNTTYGEPDADNHKAEGKWITTALTHKLVYNCCDTVAVDSESHEWVDGVCSECGYGCTHKGGKATCTAAAVCTLCGHSYGNVNTKNHTGEAVWTKTETSHKAVYNCCDAVAVAEEEHNWNNGVCEDCVYVCKHTGGTATCTSRATCEICGKMYGKLNAENHSGTPVWTKNETTHTKTYNCCGTVTVATEAHEWADGVCTECGWVCVHAGGTPTCSALAICEYCGEEHGELAPDVHKVLTPATCLDGNFCEWCGGEYGDINPENHAMAAKWTTVDNKTHEFAYECCGVATDAPVDHTFENGTCSGCGYVCVHDIGGEAKWTKTETTHNQTYTCCGLVAVATEAHEWTNGTCTECDYVCDHAAWENGVCTNCGYGCEHTGGTATCTTGKICTICTKEYTAVDPANHTVAVAWTTKTETHHESTYTCCGAVVVASEAHEWTNGACSECGYVCGHTGGTATCMAQAVCTTCGIAYGEKNANNHVLNADTAPWSSTESNCLKYCSCGEKVFDQFHEWNNGTCTKCGKTNNLISISNTYFASGTKTNIPVTFNGSGTYTILLYKGTSYDPANALNNLVMYYTAGAVTGFKSGGGTGINIYDATTANNFTEGTYTIRVWNASSQVVDTRIIQIVNTGEYSMWTARDIYNSWNATWAHPNPGPEYGYDWGVAVELKNDGQGEYVRITTKGTSAVGCGRLFLAKLNTYTGGGYVGVRYRNYSGGSIPIWMGTDVANWSAGARGTLYTAHSASEWYNGTCWAYTTMSSFGVFSLDLYTGAGDGCVLDIQYVVIGPGGADLNSTEGNNFNLVYGWG